MNARAEDPSLIDDLGLDLASLDGTALLHELYVQRIEGDLQFAELAQQLDEVALQNEELARQAEEIRRARQGTEDALANVSELYELAPTAYFTLSPDGTIVQANEAAGTLLGIVPRELVGRNFRLLVLDPFRPTFNDFLASAFASTGKATCQVQVANLAGEPRDLYVQGHAARDGRTCLTVVVDQTGLKRLEADRAALQEELHQAQKLEAVGRLAGGIAHEVNNMLSVILGNVELGLDTIPADHPLRMMLLEIQTAGKRNATLVQQLLAFARKQIITPRELDVNRHLANSLGMLRRLIRSDIEILWKPGFGLGPVSFDPTQLDMIVVNLALNAQEAIHGQGTLEFGTAAVEFPEPVAVGCSRIPPGTFVVLTVTDTGSGMSEETVQHLFEPFFFRKSFQAGAGMGLASAFGAVRQNDGHLEVSSRPGSGTTVRIYLPSRPKLAGQST